MRKRWCFGWLLVAAVLAVSLATGPAQAQIRPAGRLVTAGAAAGSGEVRAWDARLASMLRDGQLRVDRIEHDDMIAGRTHERLTQVVGGVPVFGATVVRQLDNGLTISVFGSLYDGVTVDTTPTVTVSGATSAVAALSGVTLPGSRAPQLTILPRPDGTYVLTYRARVMTPAGAVVYFIDATSGRLVFSFVDRQTSVGTGTGVHGDTKKISTTDRTTSFKAWDQMRPATVYTFDMKGNLPRTIQFLNDVVNLGEDDIAGDTDNIWDDSAVVDGHVYAGWTYDYLFKRFGRQGLDGGNQRIINLVHPVSRDEVLSQSDDVVNTFYLNAFYFGNGVMVYGEGLPSSVTAGGYRWNYFSSALDVVAHELMHGVTEYTSGLIYYNESGALNESFSDIFGTSVEYYFQDIGAGYMKADYLIGEDLTSPMGGFRSMANPQAFGDPDHYSKRYLGTQDNGGVHTNSGIANQAFYLAIEGGMNRTSGITVTGLGSNKREQIEKVFFRAFTQLLPANATFSLARAATIQAARDLYSSSADVERAIADAWSACGVQ